MVIAAFLIAEEASVKKNLYITFNNKFLKQLQIQ